VTAHAVPNRYTQPGSSSTMASAGFMASASHPVRIAREMRTE
jgi:hypothetical protein